MTRKFQESSTECSWMYSDRLASVPLCTGQYSVQSGCTSAGSKLNAVMSFFFKGICACNQNSCSCVVPAHGSS